MTDVHTAIIVVAAGRGSRAKTSTTTTPKQYRMLAGVSVLGRTLSALSDHSAIETIVPVIHPDDRSMFDDIRKHLGQSIAAPVHGGATRQASVLAGLQALQDNPPQNVLIHDGARPFLSPDLIDRIIDSLAENEGALPALPVSDTLKRGANGAVGETVPRDGLYAAQTPQGFHYAAILAAHEAAAAAGREDFTDDAAIAEWHGLHVALVEGTAHNIKLTSNEDFAMAEQRLRSDAAAPGGDWRFGHGYDVHGFSNGDHVTLCGIDIPHERTLHGHSDADVGLHALTDAILGAIGDGDIGTHFPPSDPQWRGADSHVFLSDAGSRVASKGGRIANVDVTIICEEPRIGPHREAMCSRIAEILDIDVERVSVKATTTESLGFTGRREGIAAQATASVWLP